MVNKRRIIKVLIFITVAFSIVSFASADKTTDQTVQIPEKHTIVEPQKSSKGNPVIENDNYRMELEEKTLSVTIEDKKTGFKYESVQNDEASNASWKGFMNSGVSIEFYSQKSTTPERVDMEKGTPEIKFTYYNDGFDAAMYFKTYEFSMTLEVRLTAQGMTAGVKKDSIKEGETYKLGAVYLYPMFGSTKLGDVPGYMLIPEGAGAIIDLKNNNGKFKTPYTKRIFGDNAGIDTYESGKNYQPAIKAPEEITVPVFGMIYTDKKQGFLGIVEEGRYNAEILAYPNGVTTDYNWITARFNFREVYTKQTAASSGVPSYEKNADMRDIKISYRFVSGDNSNYTGLAKTYQKYLLDQGILKKHDDKYQVKLDFFGSDSKKWFIFDVDVPMTTVKQIDQIISDLTGSNVNGILPVYTGWQANGEALSYGSGNYNLEGKLGSRKSLYALIEKLNKKGINMVLNQDFLKANPSRFYNTSKDIVKGINQMLVKVPTNQWVFENMYYFTPEKSIRSAKSFIKKYDDTVVKNVGLTSIPSTLFSYYSGGKIYTRGDTAENMTQLTEMFGNMKLSMEKPNVYVWKNTDKYFDMPLSTSNYTYLSKEVPFLPIVLKGYIPYWASDNNFQSNEKEFFLKMIEYGAYPSFLVTGESPYKLRNTNSSEIYTSEYGVLKDTIIKYYAEMGEAFGKVEGVPIKSHEYITDDIVSVEYENGVCFIINYSDTDYVSGDLTVAAMSFSVKQN